MSQSSELEEGEHPKSEEPSPIIKDEDQNNYNHKLYTRGVGALLDGIMQESDHEKSPETPKLRGKEIDTISFSETPILSNRFVLKGYIICFIYCKMCYIQIPRRQSGQIQSLISVTIM